MPEPRLQRVICYVDGFNLYFGLRSKGWRQYYWLDVCRLARNLLRPGQELAFTKYFTARISGGQRGEEAQRAARLDAKRKRQSDFLEALATLPDFQIFEGHYLRKQVKCYACGGTWDHHEEKMTDVKIATELLKDAFQDAFDTALLISADSDLVPPVLTVREFFPDKRIVAAFPPGRTSAQLTRAVNASFTIGRAKLKKSQFPDQITKSDGYTLSRPGRWQ